MRELMRPGETVRADEHLLLAYFVRSGRGVFLQSLTRTLARWLAG